jgi:hypothetical protein
MDTYTLTQLERKQGYDARFPGSGELAWWGKTQHFDDITLIDSR